MASSILPIHKRAALRFTHGEGIYLYTEDGQRYLDFAAGIAVNSLGHSHPALVKALQTQAAKLWHVSNLYEIIGMEEYAAKLTKNSFAEVVFFCNSGTEAVEAGIKMLRKYHHAKGNPKRNRIITFQGAFHGRTIATISAAGQQKYIEGFEPALEGFDNLPFDDLDAVKHAITEKTAGILVEPIQGEGGVHVASPEFMKGLRTLADKHGLLLFLDEVQSGMGRTGKLFAHEHYGIKPDILATAKGIGGGFPLGACLATKEAAQGMTAGSHGTTYGGNPLAIAVGQAVLNEILKKGFLAQVQVHGERLKEGLRKIQAAFPQIILEVRGKGLMLGLKLAEQYKAPDVVQRLRDHGLLTVPAGDNVIRILPPLIVEEAHSTEALRLLDETLKELPI